MSRPGIFRIRYLLILMSLAGCSVLVRNYADRIPVKMPDIKAPKMANVAIEQIVFEGDFHYLSKPELARRVSEILDGNFINVDLQKLKRELVANVWIEKVSVQRVWPSTLKIDVVEQVPIARWGEEGFINRYGEVIKASGMNMLEKLPVLHGDVSKSGEIAQNYLTIARLLAPKKLFVSRMTLTDDGVWSVEINGDLTLMLGRQDLMGRISLFNELFDSQFKDRLAHIDSIDFRYRNGFSIRWRATSQSLVVASQTESQVNR